MALLSVSVAPAALSSQSRVEVSTYVLSHEIIFAVMICSIPPIPVQQWTGACRTIIMSRRLDSKPALVNTQLESDMHALDLGLLPLLLAPPPALPPPRPPHREWYPASVLPIVLFWIIIAGIEHRPATYELPRCMLLSTAVDIPSNSKWNTQSN